MSFLLTGNRGEQTGGGLRIGRRRWSSPAPPVTKAAGERGKTERRTRGFDSPPHLRLWWRTEGDRRGGCRAAATAMGGGAAKLGMEMEVRSEVESEGVALL
jgi:hypothetical protein